MSNERLQEVVKNVVFLECGFTGAPMGVELPEDDYWYLYEQAEQAERYKEALEHIQREIHKAIKILEVEDDGKNKKTAGQHNDYQRTVIRVW